MMDVREQRHLRGLVTFRRFLFEVLGWQMAFQQKRGVTVEDVTSFSPPLTYFRSPLLQSEDPDTINQGFHKFSPDFIPCLNVSSMTGLNGRGQERQNRLKKREATEAASYEGRGRGSYF